VGLCGMQLCEQEKWWGMLVALCGGASTAPVSDSCCVCVRRNGTMEVEAVIANGRGTMMCPMILGAAVFRRR
jgi:hypothetical protein